MTDARRGGRGWDRRRTSFGSAAPLYERARPGYPAQAVDWLLPVGARRVLDLAAGTGKLTRGLVERGLDVVAVEPSAGMRAEFRRVLPGVPVVDGAAEAIPLDDASVDAVLVAQAWHWVDPGKASAEVARVLAPGGRLGLVWNLRDVTGTWIAALEHVISERDGSGGRTGSTGGDIDERVLVESPFGAVERADVRWTSVVTVQRLVELVASRSEVITLPPGRREGLLADVRELLATHAETAGRSEITVPYVARCFRASAAPR